MPLRYVHGDLLSAALMSSVITLVIPVNCRGIAGCGLALQCKQRYPLWFDLYRACCLDGTLRLGRPLLHGGGDPWIISFPTKDDWCSPSRLCDIEAGLAGLVQLCKRHGIISLAVPKLGCGAGGWPGEMCNLW